MKLKNIIYALAVLLFYSTTIKASETSNEISKESEFSKCLEFNNEDLDDWVMVKNENGLQTYYKTLAKDGVFQLRIKFVNTTNNTVIMNWSLTKNSDALFKGIETRIEPLGSVEKEEELVIPFSSATQSFEDYSITVKLK